MTRIVVLLISLVFVCGCSRFQPIQISASDVDAAEPVTAAAPDGGFYVAWVNHDAHNQADVMLARFDTEGSTSNSPVRVNADAGVATAWRGDPPNVAVTDRSVYVLWTARVEADGKKGADLYLAVSNDQGTTFSPAVKVNDDKLTGAHGMHSLAVSKDGRIYVAWLDERNIRAPKPSKHVN